MAKQKYTRVFHIQIKGTFHACVLNRAYVYAIFSTQEHMSTGNVVSFKSLMLSEILFGLFFAG